MKLRLPLSIGVVVVSFVGLVRADEPLPQTVDFNRDIRPILSDNCYACHGPDADKREASLRFDREQDAFAKLESGGYAIVPGKPAESKLIARILSTDPDERMPPSSTEKVLSDRQIALLKKWVEQGAKWQGHWSLLPLVRPSEPNVTNKTWPRNAVDRFLLAGIEAAGFQPSAEADRRTLARRLSFDLTGLPPKSEEVEAFIADKSPQAYEQLVTRLLDSPHYGERMAVHWLDLVRYADSIGYHSDTPRDVALYRDYVIQAFNDNLPFDRFTIEQFAGDLLPNVTSQTRIASGYNRLLQTTEEGGGQAKEYMAKYSADRVRNLGSVWLGTTVGCSECHNHKFDSYTMKDFYSLAAFFADISETPVGKQQPTPIPTADQQAKQTQLQQRLAEIQKTLDTDTPELVAAQATWEAEVAAGKVTTGVQLGPWSVIGPFAAGDYDKAFDTKFPPETEKEIKLDKKLKAGGQDVAWTPQPGWSDGVVHNPFAAENAAHYLFRTIESAAEQTLTLSLGSDDGLKVWVNGKELLANKAGRAAEADQESVTALLKKGRNEFLLKIVNGTGPSGFYFAAKQTGLPGKLSEIVATPADKRTDAQKKELATYYRSIAPQLNAARKELADAKGQLDALVKTFPLMLVSTAQSPRAIRMLPRGNWLDESGEVVEPNTPHFLPPLGVEGRRANRLDLANWLVRRDNPLVARTFVNRLWKLYFGYGLSRTLEDLGSQGEWPTHPELLDWLAAEFQDSQWNVKHLVKLLVLSQAYRQDSRVSEPLRQRDPFNRLYARQSRFRLDAEFVRDNALEISGLLVHKVGGNSVKPYQPAGYWMHMNFPTREWQKDSGDAIYRRGLYTHWQRSFLHPSLLAFDAPSREECVAERPRSNTPLQALALLNDPTYVEAARVFADRMQKEGGSTVEERIRWAMRRALSRQPTDAELKLLAELHQKHASQFASDMNATKQFLSVGDAPMTTNQPAEAAAYTSVARAILNLHEVVTRN